MTTAFDRLRETSGRRRYDFRYWREIAMIAAAIVGTSMFAAGYYFGRG